MSDQLNSCAISESCVKRELRWDKVDFFITFYQFFFLLHYTFMSFLPQCKIQTTVIAFVTEIAPPAPLTRAINHFSYHSSYPNHTKNSIISFLICKTQYTVSAAFRSAAYSSAKVSSYWTLQPVINEFHSSSGAIRLSFVFFSVVPAAQCWI